MPALSADAGPSLLSRLALAAADIKLAHSIFAIPFAVLGAFLALPSGPIDWRRFAGQLAIVVVCMVLARTWAMLFNRLVDRDIDALNPRTSRRVVAAGKLGAREAWFIALAAAGLFVGATALFFILYGNMWPLVLSVPVLVWIAFYSLTKRFTLLCHVFLGGALAASPIAAAIAINPGAVTSMPAIWFLAGMVVCWVAGFDVIYALQDEDFDRSRGLHSIPAKLGTRTAIIISRVLHLVALAFLIAAWRADSRLGWLFGIGVALVAGLLVLEHVILAKRGKAGLEMAFFTVNGVVSCVLGLSGVVDLVGV